MWNTPKKELFFLLSIKFLLGCLGIIQSILLLLDWITSHLHKRSVNHNLMYNLPLIFILGQCQSSLPVHSHQLLSLAQTQSCPTTESILIKVRHMYSSSLTISNKFGLELILKSQFQDKIKFVISGVITFKLHNCPYHCQLFAWAMTF